MCSFLHSSIQISTLVNCGLNQSTENALLDLTWFLQRTTALYHYFPCTYAQPATEGSKNMCISYFS